MNSVEDYVRSVLKALIYIEEHLDEELTIEEIAKIACYSPYHFHRIFHAVVGESLYQHVKRLRLERAADRLRNTDKPVTQIALDASYDTPSSFTKAFKQVMGISPRNYRDHDPRMETMDKKINELPMIKADKIEKISDLPLLFVRRYGDYKVSPWEAWRAMIHFVEESQLDRSKLRYFGLSHDNPEITSEEKLRYDAAISVPPNLKRRKEKLAAKF